MTDEARTEVLDIEGMTCASCVARVERKLNAIDGVEAQVSLATESARVSYPAGLDRAELTRAVDAAGYRAHLRRPDPGVREPHEAHEPHESAGHSPHDAMDHSEHHATVSSWPRVIASAILAAPVLVLGMVPAWQFPGWQWVSFALATPVVLWGGWPFHRATLKNLRHGAVTMDTLVTVGTLAAYLWSVWALVFGGAGRIGMSHGSEPGAEVYFEVAAVVTVFLLVGRAIEDRARRRAGAALRALLDLGARDVELADGRRIPTDRLLIGDEFLVRPGETIATDGVVQDGRATVDESMLTGESVPVEVAVGSEVTGGTLAQGGTLRVRATGVGAQTRLARIAALVENAQLAKSGVQRLADRISAVFVPIVIALAVLTLVGWLVAGQPVTAGFTAAVAVLIVACPCALGLATPIAILVGSGRGAQLGILITGPEAIENADRIDTVALDKTGTLTTGHMTLTAVSVVDGIDEAEARDLVGSLEAASEHPVGVAIAAASASLRPVADVTALPGRGILGAVDGRRVFAGSPEFAAEHTGTPLPAELAAVVEAHETTATVIVAGWVEPGTPARATAVFAVADTLRPEAADAVAQLRASGLAVLLLTGDAEPIARQIAASVGIDEVHARVSPEGKVALVRARQDAGHRVAMVGDGVNDAGALATADLGVAMGGGTDAASHAGDIALTGSDLGGVVTALRLSRRVMRVIRGNLFWAFAYNVAALPLAALGLLNPMIAGAAMAFSSVFVVLNSLRLRRAA
ncbi:MAG: heavy metal translocating P-type ATPase [Microbacterium sp.]|uniref:heavy metal translocating P-type ATPase n=1 Tax=Microbacterium sp. TaxID=51671 RepID=UPI002616642F|nr:heavy metal translocating P-type ATPase [Microbacterium sp.]MCX6501684.1 heavy metal translocating P-type ATPase [Microbacterium sp.]